MAKRITFILACTFYVSASLLWSQEFRGTITGTVTDPQGAVVPQAHIYVDETATRSRFTTVSNAEGLYTVPFLPPGVYRVTVEKAGFHQYLAPGIEVTAGRTVAINARLELGNTTEAVTVTGEAPLVESSNADVDQVVNTREVDNLMLNGRVPMALAWAAYGVAAPQNTQLDRPFDNSTPAGISIGGAPSGANELELNGVPNNQSGTSLAYNPPLDAVAEVQVQTLPIDAANGHASGGTVNVVLKSGTNTFHGSLYEYNRVSNLTAISFFNNLQGVGRQPSYFNQWGGMFNGPLVVPKIFNGRNKAFILFGYEGVKDRVDEPVYSTVFTAAERTGNFSALLPLGSNYAIYDPASGVVSGSTVARTPFPNNVIPQIELNPVALAYLKEFYPLPNTAGTANGENNYYAPANGEANFFNNVLSRLDLNLSDRHKINFMGRHNTRNGSGQSALGGPLTQLYSQGGSIRINFGATVDDVYSINPTTVLNTRLDWTEYYQLTANYSVGFDITTLGFPQALKNEAVQAVLPQINVGAYTTNGNYSGLGVSGEGPSRWDVYQSFASLTKVSGRHTLNFGVDLRQTRLTALSPGYPSGDYTFSTNWTRGPLATSSAAPIGQEGASFLLGLPTSGGIDVNSYSTLRAGYYALFVQDNFHVSSSLTLNMGLRWEKETPTSDVYNRTVNGFSDAASPIAAAAIAAYAQHPIPEVPVSQFQVNGGLLFAGPGNRDLYQTSNRHFAPRFGVAWTPPVMHRTMVVRGGVGLMYTALGDTGNNLTGFNYTTPFNPTNNGYLTPAATLSNPFPSGIQYPVGAAGGLATYLGQSISFYNPHELEPYSIRWDFDIQKELIKNLLLQVGYIGNHSVHLQVNRSLDYIPPQYLSTEPYRDTAQNATVSLLGGNVTNPFYNLIPGVTLGTSSTVALSQLLMAYPQFTGVTEQAVNDGSSYYQSLNVRLEKRFSQGLSVQANFAYSKLIDQTTLLNAFDPSPEKSLDGIDRPLRSSVVASYELPVGKGKPLANNAPRVVNQIIGGWVLNGVFTKQSGAVLSWGNVIYLGGPVDVNPTNIYHAFNTSVFDTKSADQLTDNIRTFPATFDNQRADGVDNLDASMIKNATLHERLRLQFRAEFFNTLNHPQFSAPSLSPTSSAFGTITGQANNTRETQFGLRLLW
jgi:hypothetical protein